MLKKLLPGLVVAATAAALVPASSASAGGSPVQDCRDALAPNVTGVCFWEGENFTGKLDPHPNPLDPDACGNITPAESVVNLTQKRREFYSGPDCDERNSIGGVEPDGELKGFKYGLAAGSWR